MSNLVKYGGGALRIDGLRACSAGSGDILPMPYMHEMIVALEAVGYERGVSLRAATYDFRAAGLPEGASSES